jgi:hypothetical protein
MVGLWFFRKDWLFMGLKVALVKFLERNFGGSFSCVVILGRKDLNIILEITLDI